MSKQNVLTPKKSSKIEEIKTPEVASPATAEIALNESERKVLTTLNNEINQSLLNIGILDMQIRDHEIQVLERKNKLNQVLQDKVGLAGYSDVKHIETDLENGVLRLILK